MGVFASALALTAALAEVADANSQRHLPRLLAAGGSAGRVAAYDRLRWLLFSAGLAFVGGAALWTAPAGERTSLTVLVLAALPMLVANRSYAAALVESRYVVMGLGPVIGLLASVALTLVASRWVQGLWGPTLGFLAGKGLESIAVHRWGTPLIPEATSVPLRQEWNKVRFLVYQVLVSAVNGRLVIPFIALLAGAEAAGLLAVGINLLSIVTLMALAFTVPAYRTALESGLAATPGEALSRVRGEWRLAVVLGAMLTVLICVAVPWVLPLAFGIRAREGTLTVVLVAAGARFEPLNIFGASLYHASLQDLSLFRLGLFNVAAGWLMTGGGGLVGGPVGMALGFLASRAFCTFVLYLPLLRSAHGNGLLAATRTAAARPGEPRP